MHLPYGIQTSAQALEIGNMMRQRRTSWFKSPYRLTAKLQGI